MDTVVQIQRASKIIEKKSILKNIDMTLQRGQCYGLTGHNGAGKSMLLRLISGLILPTEGTVTVFGKTLGKDCEFAPKTGVAIDGSGFLPDHSGFKNLKMLAMIQDQINEDDIRHTISKVGLDPDDTSAVKTYSKGMKQRLNIAQAIMEKPQLLLLDEPTSAIDRQSVQEIHQLFKNLLSQGVTLVIASHTQLELEALCDEIFEMSNGDLMLAEAIREPEFLT